MRSELLRARDCALAVEAAATLTLAWAALRLLPNRLLAPLLRSAPPHRACRPVAPEHVLQMVERVAGRHACRPQCLERALAGRWMLARRGVSATIVIGASRSARHFEAHAWVEVDGHVPVGDGHARRFTPLWRHDG